MFTILSKSSLSDPRTLLKFVKHEDYLLPEDPDVDLYLLIESS